MTSRLEIYVEILASLEELQTCSLATLDGKLRIGNTLLQNAISFLERQGLMQQEKRGDEILYSITSLGERITRYFMVQDREATATFL